MEGFFRENFFSFLEKIQKYKNIFLLIMKDNHFGLVHTKFHSISLLTLAAIHKSMLKNEKFDA